MDAATEQARAPAIARELLLISGLFVAIIATLVGVTWAGVSVLSALRGYVVGEGLYSKGQKDAVYHLVRYAATRDEAEYRGYRAAIAVPLADGRARAELERPGGSLAAAERSLEAGRNHPDDVASMAQLFRHAGWLAEMERAIRIWEVADAEIGRLDAAAQALHAALRGGAPEAERVGALLAEIDAADARLTGLEDSFSSTLGAAARRIHRLVIAAAFAASAALLAIGVVATARTLSRIRRRDERFRAMIENAQDVITIIRPDGVLVYNSPAIRRVLGYRPEELAGRSAFELIHADDHRPVVAALGRVVAEPGSTQSAEFRFRHANGTWRTLAAIGGSLPGGSEVAAVVVNSRDVTDRKLLEEQLLHAQKMESIGRLAGGIAHDFNNLITVMLGCAGAVRDELAAGSAALPDLDEIVHAAERAAGLTRRLLAFARRQVIEPRVVDLDAVILELEPMLRRLIGVDVGLEITPSPEPLQVRADPGQLEQVLVNLVMNARDAMPDGGRVAIATAPARVASDEARLLTDGAEGDFARVEVRDTGVAMSEEVRRHLFEPFFTTKELGKGTGLGLAICYGIVKQSGGHISVESEPGRGTCFRIHLPRVDAEASAGDGARAAEQREPRGSETVLLVEDDESVRRFTRGVLTSKGYSVVAVPGGHEALSAIGSLDSEVALLVTDVVMPRLGGKQLAARLAERGELAVLYVSGYTEDPAFQRDIDEVGLPFLAKPFTPASLARRVREVLDAGKPEARAR